MVAPPSSLQRPMPVLWPLQQSQVYTNNAWLACSLIPWLPPEGREPCPLPGRLQVLHYAKKLRKCLHLDQQGKTQGQRQAIQA